MIWMCFGVGINNFATGQTSTVSLIRSLNSRLVAVKAAPVAAYGHSGNLAIEAPYRSRVRIEAVLAAATRTRWTAIPADDLLDGIHRLDRWSPPDPKRGMRWTPGLCMAVGSPPLGKLTLKTTPRAIYRRVGPDIVAAYKEDVLLPSGRLDPKKRRGGWGALSAEVGRQLGGTWTARSRRTIDGLVSRVP